MAGYLKIGNDDALQQLKEIINKHNFSKLSMIDDLISSNPITACNVLRCPARPAAIVSSGESESRALYRWNCTYPSYYFKTSLVVTFVFTSANKRCHVLTIRWRAFSIALYCVLLAVRL